MAGVPGPGSRVHLVGVGGIGMAALAQYLVHVGAMVSGSDLRNGPQLDILRTLGIEARVGHRAENVEDADLVVITAAASEDNPEVVAATRAGIEIVKRAKLLGRIVDQGRSIAVAGTHGKTTITALAGHIMRQAGRDPTILGGGLMRTRGQANEARDELVGPAIPGSPRLFVVEADEYDRSFLSLHPTIAVMTAVDYDHPDCYATLEELEQAFLTFAGSATKSLIVSGKSSRLVNIAIGSGRAWQTYGVGEGFDWQARDISAGPHGPSYRLVHAGGEAGRVSIRLPGVHNVENSLAAIAAVSVLDDLDPSTLLPALESFAGTSRRLETKGTVGGVTVVDDYAHHPAEITAALEALRRPDSRLLVLFQPHTYSRTKALLTEFGDALSLADQVVLLDAYAARETREQGLDSSALQHELEIRGASSTHEPDPGRAIRTLVGSAAPGDIIITMGAGDVTDLAGPILAQLEDSRKPC